MKSANEFSPPQASALKEAAARPLYRCRAGWGQDGWHSTGTVKSLERRGFLRVEPYAGCMGRATITAAGRAWARALGLQGGGTMTNEPTERLIVTVEEALRAADAETGPWPDDPRLAADWHRKRSAAFARMADRLAGEEGARFSERGDTSAVNLSGIRASSTMGIGAALKNWLRAARTRLGARQ